MIWQVSSTATYCNLLRDALVERGDEIPLIGMDQLNVLGKAMRILSTSEPITRATPLSLEDAKFYFMASKTNDVSLHISIWLLLNTGGRNTDITRIRNVTWDECHLHVDWGLTKTARKQTDLETSVVNEFLRTNRSPAMPTKSKHHTPYSLRRAAIQRFIEQHRDKEGHVAWDRVIALTGHCDHKVVKNVYALSATELAGLDTANLQEVQKELERGPSEEDSQ